MVFYFRLLGGTPVDRSQNNNLVDSIVHLFNSKEEFRLGLSPEGTRKKVAKWKTGFYYIAKGANVPIVMATLDFGNKQIKISKAYTITEIHGYDFTYFHAFFSHVQGKKSRAVLSQKVVVFLNTNRLFMQIFQRLFQRSEQLLQLLLSWIQQEHIHISHENDVLQQKYLDKAIL